MKRHSSKSATTLTAKPSAAKTDAAVKAKCSPQSSRRLTALCSLLGVLVVACAGLWWCGYFDRPVSLVDAYDDGSYRSLVVVHRRAGFRIPAEQWGELKPAALTRHWSAEMTAFSPEGGPLEHGWYRPFPICSGNVTSDNPAAGFVREGRWIGWHPDGTRSHALTYWGGMKHGRLEAWHPNGQLRETGTFERDAKLGEWTTWHANGEVEAREHYVAGKLHGPRTTWHANGNVRSKHEFQHGLMVGDELVYDKDGKLSAKSTWIDGQENGTRTVITSDRRIEQEVVNGKLHGNHREFDAAGNVLVEGQSRNDQPQGAWVSYFPSGDKEWERRYQSGQLDGPERRWYANGTQHIEGANRAGQLQGPWTEWDAAGKKRAEGEWYDGRRHGGWTFFADGLPVRHTTYDRGKIMESTRVTADNRATVPDPP